MKETEEQVKEWLIQHASQIGPEELISEESKQKLFDGSWPVPQEIQNMGVFSNIKDATSFNNIVGNPNNWFIIINTPELFEKWILPHAVLYFGKFWFNKVKRRNSISKGISFPLFPKEERVDDIESSPQGRATISKIVEKISIVLRTYLEGKWYSGENKKPSGYIINSLKNEFIKEVSMDMGYKPKSVPACPFCLSHKPISKTPLINYQNISYSCDRCKSVVDNLELKIKSLQKQGSQKELETVLAAQQVRKRFEKFIGITCVCPSDKCLGHFVPLSCVDKTRLKRFDFKGALKNFPVCKNTQTFHRPPEILLDFPLTCPYCGTNFTPREALDRASGFGSKSGFFTGVPSTTIWVKEEEAILDANKTFDDNYGESFKDQIAGTPDFSDNNIIIKQHINILIGEVIIKMSKISRKTIRGLTLWCFLASIISWMIKHREDANNYFFNCETVERDMTELEKTKYLGKTKKKNTRNTSGQGVAVHQSIFHEWMTVIESNIEEFTKLDPKTKTLKNFGWFCRCPKFSGGPETLFYSVVDNSRRIVNKTPIRESKSENMPRLAKIYSICKNGNDYSDQIEKVEWHAIKLKSTTSLELGDKVLVKALVMSGHPTHAPIQRILRLRALILKDIIDRVLSEERTGQSDQEFWQNWKQKVVKARKNIEIIIGSNNGKEKEED
jgi:hypothetical protein